MTLADLRVIINRWLVEGGKVNIEDMNGVDTVAGVVAYMEGRLRAFKEVLEEIDKLDRS